MKPHRKSWQEMQVYPKSRSTVLAVPSLTGWAA
nr:MAG TPA: hypothetical protein [Bacteriophage sp.]